MSNKSLRDMMKDKKVSPDTMTEDQRAQYEMLKGKAEQLKDKDLSDVMKEIDRLKMNKDVLARLKGKDMDTFKETLKPMLSPEQQRKLDDLVKYLRKG